MSEALPLLAPSSYRLSKSKFVAGLQCHKRLYLEIHKPNLAQPPDEATQAILDMGTDLGTLARQRFPGGILVDVDYRRTNEVLERTTALFNDPSVPALFEGAFQWDGVLVRVDVLERVRAEDGRAMGWRLIEVKSSSKIKDVHLPDLAIQSYVLKGAGVPLVEVCLLHVNTQYVYPGGDIDVTQLFTLNNLVDLVASREVEVPALLQEMKHMLAQSTEPLVEPDHHCHRPHECPFWSYCTKDKSARWIFRLPGGEGAYRTLSERGIQTIDEIPDAVRLSPVQRLMKSNCEWVSPKLAMELDKVHYPVHHLDFETFMPAVPRFPTTRPYETIPTQWSNHIESEDGSVCHNDFLSSGLEDPREALMKTLLASLGEAGTICVYSAYERAVLSRLAEVFPQFRSELQSVLARLWDLYEVIKAHYYHPEFNGSYSIKAVLPAVVPSLGYEDLDIRDGGSAARAYYLMVFEETDWIERQRFREALLQYCARDTLAMLELRRALREKARQAYS